MARRRAPHPQQHARSTQHRMAGAPHQGYGPPGADTPGRAAQHAVPFDQAAHRGMELGPTFVVTPTTSQQTFGPVPLPAQGYLRRVIIDISSAGGVAGPGVASADFPFNILALIRLQDTNGAPLCELSGYNLYLMDTYGGFAGSPDPRNDPDYSASVAAPSIQLSIPVEIAPNGMGSLANQSAAAAYRLTLTVDTLANIWSTLNTTPPTFTIRTIMDFWTLPAPADMLHRPQMRVPPFNGTAQYFTQQPNVGVVAGQNNTRITRVGNLIRLLGLVARTNAGARADDRFPDPFVLNWDSRDLYASITAKTLRKVMREFIEQLVSRDTGVYVFNWSYGDDRHAGDDAINSWLATVSGTRFEVDGLSANAGTLDILVNDVSVAETSPAARAVETSATGYHPPVAPTVMGAQ